MPTERFHLSKEGLKEFVDWVHDMSSKPETSITKTFDSIKMMSEMMKIKECINRIIFSQGNSEDALKEIKEFNDSKLLI